MIPPTSSEHSQEHRAARPPKRQRRDSAQEGSFGMEGVVTCGGWFSPPQPDGGGPAAARGEAAEPAGPEEQQLGRQGLIDRTQYLRLLQQSLCSLGFGEVAARLEQASGVRCEAPRVAELQRRVLGGDWAGAAACLDGLGLAPPELVDGARFLLVEGRFLEALHRGDTAQALACLRRELRPLAAATCRLGRLRELSSCLLCPTPRDLERHSAWGGNAGGEAEAQGICGDNDMEVEAPAPAQAQLSNGEGRSSSFEGSAAAAMAAGAGGRGARGSRRGDEEGMRHRMACDGEGEGEEAAGGGGACGALRRRALARLRSVLPPDLLLPPRRLEVLVEQALAWQLARCPLHNSPGAAPSLLRDYSCGMEQVPTLTTQVLRDHEDEVWHVAFSPCGTMLASASKDGTARLYDVRGAGALALRHTLRGHAGAVAFLCWAPRGDLLATCGADRRVRVWEAASGRCVAVLVHHSEPVTSAAFLPDGRTLVTGGHDRQMCLVDLEGRMLRRWPLGLQVRVQDLAVAKGGRYVLATTTERRVCVFDIAGEEGAGAGAGGACLGPREPWLQERDTILSMTLSQDSRYLLLNLASQELHLWDLGPGPALRMPSLPCAVYAPAEPAGAHSRYVVRACLGGLGQKFVLTGSEESKVYLYQRHTGGLLASLGGHSAVVNAVAWNPTDPHMFASASDDRTVRVWGLEAAVAARL